MEASALPAPAAPARISAPAGLLRLRSDEQLVALFRSGSDEAFRAIHDRYRPRLLAYARQMLGGSRGEAEDVLQDVFVRAYAGLRSNGRPISLRAWLYRIAHNRCIDVVRRPWPIPSEISNVAVLALSRGHRHDPAVEIERSERLTRLVADMQALPEQQRSVLLMRELQGLSYEELACALGISGAAVKSLLLRARTGLIDAADARDTPCAEIRVELSSAHDRGVRASGRARRHMRECDACRAYRVELRSLRRSLTGLVPTGPFGQLGMLLGIGGGGAAGSGGLAAGGGGAAALGGAATVTATKVATLVCCAALVGAAGSALQAPSPHHAPAPRHPSVGVVSHRAVVDPRVVARVAGGTLAPVVAAAHGATSVAALPVSATPPLPAGQASFSLLASVLDGALTTAVKPPAPSQKTPPAATTGSAGGAPGSATTPSGTGTSTGTGAAAGAGAGQGSAKTAASSPQPAGSNSGSTQAPGSSTSSTTSVKPPPAATAAAATPQPTTPAASR